MMQGKTAANVKVGDSFSAVFCGSADGKNLGDKGAGAEVVEASSISGGGNKDVRIDEVAGWEIVGSTETFLKDTALSSPDSSLPSCSSDDREGQEAGREVTKDQVARYRKAFENDSTAKVAQNACLHHSVQKIALRRDLLQTDFAFSVRLDQSGMRATNQNDSGRCWLFAALNLLRMAASPKLKLSSFEFSESYLHFWDKLEKANIFLETILQTADRPLEDRTLSFLLEDPITDGGDWMPAMSLVAKYGLVPKSVYPESHTSNNTYVMNSVLQYALLSSAKEIRAMLEQGQSMEEARECKNRRMDDIWRVLCIHLGTPPEQFNWQWRDEDGAFHRRGIVTPLEFVKETVDIPWKSYVCLIQDPRNEYYQTYTVEFSQTLLGGFEAIFLNVPAEDMKLINQKMLEDGLPVWFACNVDEEFADRQGLWDANLYDLENLYGVKSFGMSKADKLRFGYSMGTHAMLFTGVDVQEGKARRWRVENSYGTVGHGIGGSGYYCMNDNWYDEYVFEIIVPPSYLTDEMIAGFKTAPIVLPAWDAMGSSCGSRRARRCG